MKNIFVYVLCFFILSGCTYYDYYKGDVQYTQDGEDCVYSSFEKGREINADIRSLDAGQKIIYRNIKCANLYDFDVNKDFIEQKKVSDNACNKGTNLILKRRYIIIPQ